MFNAIKTIRLRLKLWGRSFIYNVMKSQYEAFAWSQTKLCPYCQKANRYDALYCAYCGQSSATQSFAPIPAIISPTRTNTTDNPSERYTPLALQNSLPPSAKRLFLSAQDINEIHPQAADPDLAPISSQQDDESIYIEPITVHFPLSPITHRFLSYVRHSKKKVGPATLRHRLQQEKDNPAVILNMPEANQTRWNTSQSHMMRP